MGTEEATPATPEVDEAHARILFDCDRVCCVCHDRTRKHIQVHHIDGKHGNNAYENLAVLCLECHNDTLVSGGFGRKLKARQVCMFRKDWIAQVKAERRARPPAPPRLVPNIAFDDSCEAARVFLRQMYDARILPKGAVYQFVAFGFTMPGMLHVVTDCAQLDPRDPYDLEGILAAYVLCGLGAIAPKGMISTDSAHPDRMDAPDWRYQPIRNGPTIKAPRWFVSGAEDVGLIAVTVGLDAPTEQIFLFIHPVVMVPGRDYAVLDGKLTRIGQCFAGRSLTV